jgi:DNA mismatch endonuclease, patch repair protein
MDILTPEERSERMSKIRGKDTKPELVVRKFLHANGYRYKLHDKSLPGRPDIKLPKYKTVIEINGCFWHGHDHCKNAQTPASNKDFWKNKIENNKKKDALNLQALSNLGWKVITIWECELKPYKLQETLKLLINTLGKF